MQGIPNNPYAQSRYVKLREGTIKLRLFDSIDGWEYWTDAQGQVVQKGKRAGDGGKPNRIPQTELSELKLEARQNAQYFKAYKVYNYESGRIEILQLKQRTILEPLISYFYDEDWGNGKGLDTFDIAITRTGEGLDTVYQVTPKPKTEFIGKMEDINLEALYSGDDPFIGSTATVAEEKENIDLDDVAKEMEKGADNMHAIFDGKLPEDE